MNGARRPFSFTGRVRSMRFAVAGVREMLATQHNAWIHAAATVLVVVVGLILHVSAVSWCVLVLAIALVWVAEALNTALELLCDIVSPEFHPLVAKAKDIAAGGVLLAAVAAVAIGILILGPGLLAYL